MNTRILFAEQRKTDLNQYFNIFFIIQVLGNKSIIMILMGKQNSTLLW